MEKVKTLLSRSEAAKIAHVTPSVISIWISRGKLHPIYYGNQFKNRKYLIELRDLERAVSSPYRNIKFAPDDKLISITELARNLSMDEHELEQLVDDRQIVKYELNWDKSVRFVAREDVAELVNYPDLDFVWYGS